MDIHIHIEKKHFLIIVALIALLGIFMIGSAEDVSQDLPYHYLQQVSKSDSDMTSVDSNENKIIDEAENLSASGDSHVLNNLIMHADLDMDGNNINNIGKVGDVDSTDMVANLNADMVDGADASSLGANNLCSGNNVFLDGDGNCRDITTNYGSPIHGDLIQSNTVDSGKINDGSGSGLDADMVDGVQASGLTPPTCTGENKALQYDGSNWICKDISSGSSVNYLVNNAHTEGACLAEGGEVVSDGSGNEFCRVSSSSCPTGWNQYHQWSTTLDKCCGDCDGGCGGTPLCCDVYGHSWSDQTQESCTYTGGMDEKTCYATMTEIGCY